MAISCRVRKNTMFFLKTASYRKKNATFANNSSKNTIYEKNISSTGRYLPVGDERLCNGPSRSPCSMWTCAHPQPTQMAGHGDVCVYPLLDEHLHRPGMGFRQRRPQFVQSSEPRLPTVGTCLQTSWHARHYFHRQAPLRFLYVALRLY